jgi:hypothetical protein
VLSVQAAAGSHAAEQRAHEAPRQSVVSRRQSAMVGRAWSGPQRCAAAIDGHWLSSWAAAAKVLAAVWVLQACRAAAEACDARAAWEGLLAQALQSAEVIHPVQGRAQGIATEGAPQGTSYGILQGGCMDALLCCRAAAAGLRGLLPERRGAAAAAQQASPQSCSCISAVAVQLPCQAVAGVGHLLCRHSCCLAGGA